MSENTSVNTRDNVPGVEIIENTPLSITNEHGGKGNITHVTPEPEVSEPEETRFCLPAGDTGSDNAVQLDIEHDSVDVDVGTEALAKQVLEDIQSEGDLNTPQPTDLEIALKRRRYANTSYARTLGRLKNPNQAQADAIAVVNHGFEAIAVDGTPNLGDWDTHHQGANQSWFASADTYRTAMLNAGYAKAQAQAIWTRLNAIANDLHGRGVHSFI